MTHVITPKVGAVADEIMTIDELAAYLKMGRSSVYEMTRKRAQVRHPNPLPVCRIGGHIRFRKSDVDAWIARCVENQPRGERVCGR